MHDITGPLLQPLGMGTLETVAKGTEKERKKERERERGGQEKNLKGKTDS